jgi:hypothetical protein
VTVGLGPVAPGKSLAPYRECRGVKSSETEERSSRGTFDRGDLKEAGGAAVRGMEPLAWWWSFEAG